MLHLSNNAINQLPEGMSQLVLLKEFDLLNNNLLSFVNMPLMKHVLNGSSGQGCVIIEVLVFQ